MALQVTNQGLSSVSNVVETTNSSKLVQYEPLFSIGENNVHAKLLGQESDKFGLTQIAGSTEKGDLAPRQSTTLHLTVGVDQSEFNTHVHPEDQGTSQGSLNIAFTFN